MKNRILLIVDAQYDFIDGGNLPIGNSMEAMNNLADYIINQGKEYDTIILTADWHPQSHMSFKNNGGEWPKHCVQHSHGAAIYNPILEALNSIGAQYVVLTKGCDEDHEEYSIFKNAASKKYLATLYNAKKVELMDICGLAGDICVLNTIKDGLVEFPTTTFNVLKEYAPSLDGGIALNNFICKNERVVCQG